MPADRWTVRWLLLVAVVLGVLPAQAPGESQTWEGKVLLGGAELGFVVRLDPGADPPSGTIDIPQQGARGLALSDIEMTDEVIRFVLELPAGPEVRAVFDMERVGDGQATGTMKQMAITAPISMKRLSAEEAEALGPVRPQTPEPPFPYETREVSFAGGGDGVTLAGTLSVPGGDGPHPAVVLVSGSGPQDRNETLFDHKPFAVIADYLARAGIASLRYDDRGFAQSTGDFASATTDDLAADAGAALGFLAQQEGVDDEALGIIGHSEGGVIAPIVAAGDERVAFIVLLAGTGVPGEEVLIEQGAALLLASGADPEKIGEVRRSHRATLEAAMVEPFDAEAFTTAMRMLVSAQGSAMGQAVPPAALEQITPAQADQFTGPWMRRFLQLDPREALREVSVPVLVLNGNLDRQVIPEQNVPAIVGALREGGNERVTVHVFPNLNHLFQPARAGTVGEYAEIEQTMAPAVLEMIGQWIGGVVAE